MRAGALGAATPAFAPTLGPTFAPGFAAAVLALVASLVLPIRARAQDGVRTGVGPACSVERVIDGDTFVCEGGERVRLILVDTPEMGDEPLGRLAREFVTQLLPPGTEVGLRLGVQERDRYGRLLAYVELPDGRMLNRVVAREGYAQVMVVPPNVDEVERIRAAVDSARAEGAGLWGRPGFGEARSPDADRGGGAGGSTGQPDGRPDGGCDPSYPDVCLPSPPPDLDCRDVEPERFRVVGEDPHRFDGDGDGIGCEGPGRIGREPGKRFSWNGRDDGRFGRGPRRRRRQASANVSAGTPRPTSPSVPISGTRASRLVPSKRPTSATRRASCP